MVTREQSRAWALDANESTLGGDYANESTLGGDYANETLWDGMGPSMWSEGGGFHPRGQPNSRSFLLPDSQAPLSPQSSTSHLCRVQYRTFFSALIAFLQMQFTWTNSST